MRALVVLASGLLLLSHIVSAEPADPATDHSQPEVAETPNAKTTGGAGSSSGAAAKETTRDASQVLEDSLRRLPDPGVLGLSRKLLEEMKGAPRMTSEAFAKIVDQVPAISESQKSQLKKGFDELAQNFGSTTGAQLLSTMNSIVKERGLLANPFAGGETPAASGSSSESDKDKLVRERLRDLEDARLRQMLMARDRKDRDEDNDRPRSSTNQNQQVPGQNQNGQSSRRGAKEDENHKTDRSRSNDQTTASRSQASPSSLGNDPVSTPKPSPSSLPDYSAKRTKSSPTNAPSPSPDPSADDAIANSNAAPKMKTVNLGTLGGTSSPPAVAPPGGGFGFGASDFGGGIGAAIAGAIAGAKGAVSAMAGGADGGFMNMTYSDENYGLGQKSGSISTGGVNYVGGSGPDSEEGSGVNTEQPEYTKKAQIVSSENGSRWIYSIGSGEILPGIFQHKPRLRKDACERLGHC
ncbi:MAG: hypothetical protein HYR96_12230 [Deltaproteobacteria bacterium]|nr:hypothetical protein [Deltaproteobacteria bacterium]